jgi:arylsulfate sulfotransferase
MKPSSLLLVGAIVHFAVRSVSGTQADDTTITIVDNTPGATPFISQVHLMASDTTVLRSIQFAIAPKPGSKTRPLSAIYERSYLLDAGYLQDGSLDIYLPVYGLYHDYANTITLSYRFNDGSSKQATTSITAAAFDDTCGYENPTVLQARTDDTTLSYDYIFVKERCNSFSPSIIDTDSTLRWVGPAGIFNYTSAFFDNAAYVSADTTLYRLDLDGTVTLLHNYSDINVVLLHHNIDRGKAGLLLEADTTDYIESVVIEVDAAGNVLKTWNLAQIISDAMIAGGDDPTQFVYPSPADWFHNNETFYNRADDTLIVSSRENFVIGLDYESGSIKWILGDPTKKWHEFPSLVNYALTVTTDSLPPIGQHSPSLTYDNELLLFDNGLNSLFQMPPGTLRPYSSPRKYRLDFAAGTATEVWNYERDQSVTSPICGSVYEDAPNNYLVDYAFVGGFVVETPYAELLGLNAAGEKVFHYQYPTANCNEAFNSVPLHLEKTSFPAIEPRPLNLSTRGVIGSGEEVLIGGFIITGTEDKEVALRVLGPSLTDSGLTDTLADPALTLYDVSGTVVATNDDWESDASAAVITANGLAPANAKEAALAQTLAPGAYTVIATGNGDDTGIGLIEVYDLSPAGDSKLANISTRGSVGTGDDVLIAGFIVGDVANATVVLRALGPSLTSDLSEILSDPTLTVYDGNGVVLATNDNWQDDLNMLEINQDGLAPTDDAEAATLLHAAPGAYSVVVSGADGGSGISLVELFDLD